MSTTQLLINIVGLAAIAWIIWYFWFWKREAVTARTGNTGVQEVDVTVKGGYQPAAIVVKAGQPLRLRFTRRESSLCGEEVVIPDFGMRAHLPENVAVPIEITPSRPGEYEFTCGMNMYKGRLIVEQ